MGSVRSGFEPGGRGCTCSICWVTAPKGSCQSRASTSWRATIGRQAESLIAGRETMYGSWWTTMALASSTATVTSPEVGNPGPPSCPPPAIELLLAQRTRLTIRPHSRGGRAGESRHSCPYWLLLLAPAFELFPDEAAQALPRCGHGAAPAEPDAGDHAEESRAHHAPLHFLAVEVALLLVLDVAVLAHSLDVGEARM